MQVTVKGFIADFLLKIFWKRFNRFVAMYPDLNAMAYPEDVLSVGIGCPDVYRGHDGGIYLLQHDGSGYMLSQYVEGVFPVSRFEPLEEMEAVD